MVRESTAASALAALARCAASFLPPPVDRLCHDPLGARLAGYGRAAALLEAWPGAARALLSAGGWGGPLGRAAADAALTAAAACRLLDDEVLRWAEAGERQVVLLAAGFDTRSVRLAPRLAGVALYETGPPARSARKAAALAAQPHCPSLALVPHDADAEPATWALPPKLAALGLNPEWPTLVLLDGVLECLCADGVAAALACAAALSPAPGSRLVMTYTRRGGGGGGGGGRAGAAAAGGGGCADDDGDDAASSSACSQLLGRSHPDLLCPGVDHSQPQQQQPRLRPAGGEPPCFGALLSAAACAAAAGLGGALRGAALRLLGVEPPRFRGWACPADAAAWLGRCGGWRLCADESVADAAAAPPEPGLGLGAGGLGVPEEWARRLQAGGGRVAAATRDGGGGRGDGDAASFAGRVPALGVADGRFW